MLRLITGGAGTGKTNRIIAEISSAVARGESGVLLIVPEQYSHEAERELCAVCGDRFSLSAEVLSFTQFARRVASKQGGAALPLLDKGGRLLCMALALRSVGSRLKVYSTAARRPELHSLLLRQLDELKASCVSADRLLTAADTLDDGLGDKLRDLALIAESYDAVVANGRTDPSDRLAVLARQLVDYPTEAVRRVYVDGFIDFTRQEREVLRALLKKGAQLTVCLTLDELYGDNEIFELSRLAARSLLSDAQELGIDSNVEKTDGGAGRSDALLFFADNMFSYSAVSAPDTGAVRLFRAENMQSECELAAAESLRLVRDAGCRWRDIAVAVRGYGDYAASLESAFAQYGVPLFTAERNDLLEKPLPALIAGAYEIISGGWDVDDVTSYMRTGLTGLNTDECDLLGDYIFKWQLRAGAWERKSDWRQHPLGYGNEYDDEAETRLRRVNELRRQLAAPLLHLQKRAGAASTALGQARALADFFEELGLAQTLAARTDSLRESGQEKLAAEYSQLWDIIVSALEQCAAILGESEMDMDEFSRLFTLMLSKYDIGTIPVALDRVSAGDFDRMRRRSIKYLIVLGAADARLPRAEEERGMFSDEERSRLLPLDIDLGGAGDGELWREFSLIYSCLTLPSSGLELIYPAVDAEGNEQRPAFVFNRARALFDLEIKTADPTVLRMSASVPAFTLAADALCGGGPRSAAAAEYFRREAPQSFAALERAAKLSRGRLSGRAVEALYGRRIRLSASRIDRFESCRFAYFCQYGLRARPYDPAGFTPPEIGTFMHFVLERTAREVRERGGFAAVSDEELRKITDRHVESYVDEELNGFQEKTPRFIYLFKRLCLDVRQIVADMADELRRSDFEPLEFELDFAKAGLSMPEAGDADVSLSGIADRVDGWLHDGKLYLRVVDYKTGKKKFSLSDVWYGTGLQMLLYLFALESGGERLYGSEIVPAGVMYVPARNAILPVTRDISDGDAVNKRLDEIRRSGIVLDEPSVIEAWEKGADKRYIPVKGSSGKFNPETVASSARLGVLSRHVKSCLEKMALELQSGSIDADPYFRDQHESACLSCNFSGVCHFDDDGECGRYQPKLKPEKVWSLMEEGQEHE